MFVELFSKLSYFPLPGKKAQLKAAPANRFKNISKNVINLKRAKKAAVLIYCYPKKEKTYFSLIKRSNYNGVHSGQISLPGGKFDKNDSSLKETALRECGEELGITIDSNKDLFPLTQLYIPPSNFIVTPYLAYENFYPKFNPDSREVALHIEISIEELKKLKIEKKILINEYQNDSLIPCYTYKGHIIWGATAMILSEFKSLLASLELN